MSDKPVTPPGAPQIQIEMDPALSNGVFVNFAMVNHSDGEFTLDLLYLHPEAPKATVRARAIMTPRQMKRLITAMQDNLARYESIFGTVDVSMPANLPKPGFN